MTTRNTNVLVVEDDPQILNLERLILYQFYLMESYIGPPALSLSKGAAKHDVARSNWY